jgi:hypothetical protein
MKVRQVLDMVRDLDPDDDVFCCIYSRNDVAQVDESLPMLVSDDVWSEIIRRMDNIPLHSEFEDIVYDEMGA